MSEIAIKARELGKRYDLGRKADHGEGTREFWALRDVSFDVGRGETIGIIGNNGAGKSTMLKILARITDPTHGRVEIHGRTGALLEVGTGFHGELSGRENILLNGVIIGMKRADILKKFDEIVEFAGVGAFLDTPVKKYSSGMYMRLAFSVAAHLDPDILIVDEVLAVGDAGFQKKCLGKLQDVATRSQRTVLFVSHNLQAVQQLCGRAMHIEKGRIRTFGETRAVVGQYLALGDAASSSRRWEEDAPGDALVRLRAVTVKANGELSGVYSSSHAIAVELEVEASEPLDGFDVGFDLSTSDGVAVLSTYSADAGDGRARGLGAGLNRFRCVVPAGLLNAGVYKVTANVVDARGNWIVNEAGAVSFEVVLDHGVSPYWNSLNASSRPGLIAPILDWREAKTARVAC